MKDKLLNRLMRKGIQCQIKINENYIEEVTVPYKDRSIAFKLANKCDGLNGLEFNYESKLVTFKFNK